MDSPWMTTEQCAEYLRLGSTWCVYRLVRDHRLPHGRVGKAYRFNRAAVDRWVAEQGAQSLSTVRRMAS